MRQPRPHRGTWVPDVADHVAVRAGRGPAREDDVDLRRLVVARRVADVPSIGKLHDLPRPRQDRVLAQVEDDVAMQRERVPLAAQAQRHAAIGAGQLDGGVGAGELGDLPAKRHAGRRQPGGNEVGDR